MRRDKDEIIPADRGAQKSWLLFVLLYVLFLFWLEPLIDFMLSAMPPDKAHDAIDAFNQRKVYVATIAFGVARALPILFFLWLGSVIMQTQSLPPKGLKLPITVRLIKGPKARMAGMLMVSLSLLLVLREITMLMSVRPV
jgi:hypothetical protein